MGVDAAIAAVAARQRGQVTYGQLRAAGLSADGVRWRVRTGRLYRVHRGVYLVGHTVMPPLGEEMGAVLACGEGAVLSHRSAAGVWGFAKSPRTPVDVTVVGRGRARRPGLRVHVARSLHPRDRTRRHDIPITTPARTLLDFAELAPPRELERAWDEAHVERIVRPAQVQEVLGRAGGRRGAAAIKALMERDAGPALTKREAEERMFALVRAADLPAPEVNARVGPYEVDLLWRVQRLVVEIDSWRYHARAKFESDRVRDDWLQANGYRVMRVTWRWIVDRPEALIARVAAALAQSSAV